MKNEHCEVPDVVCYLCAIVDDNLKRERHITFNNPAAENKVLGICNALKPHVKHVVVVSVGRGGGVRNGSRFPAVARRVSDILVLYAAFWHNRFFSYVVTAYSLILLLFRLKKLSRKKRVCLIAYNRNWFYFPMLCFSRLLHIDCYLDLEDGPIVRDTNVLQRLALWVKVIVNDSLCNQGALFASSLLLDKAGHKRKLVCHGVAYKRKNTTFKQPGDMNPIRILFGGHLSRETGALLFMDCVRLIEHEHKDIHGRIQFVVTGKGPLLNALEQFLLESNNSWVEYHGEVDFATYKALLARVDVGLCLKLPSSEMCNTTFPSKVVEYASFGKAVLSTGIDDVVKLFEVDGAYLLQDESVDGLVNMIRKIALEPEQVRVVAERGRLRLIEKSGRDAVAGGIMNLLTDEI